MNDVLMAHDAYTDLRIESREALHRLGIPSNPGFTDENIVHGLAHVIGVEATMEQLDPDFVDFSGEFFRDNLGQLLGLDLPASVHDVIHGLRRL